MDQVRLSFALFTVTCVAACGSSSGSQDFDAGPEVDASIPSGQVKIRRDEHGIPHIEASTDVDAMRGLGYATAQDRLLHMNLMAYAVQGRLSSVLGRLPIGNSNSVALDRELLTFGHWRHAQAVAETLPADTLALLQAYADGVNEFVSEVGVDTDLMSQLGMTPQAWTPAHSIAMWYWVGRFFSPNGLNKAKSLHEFEADVRANGLDAVLEARLCNLPGGDPSTGIVQLGDVPTATVDAINAYATSVGQVPHPCPSNSSARTVPMFYDHDSPKFSHAWVVGGANTSTGAAVLVSDPQTPVSFPAIWYEAAIDGDSIKARGVGIPGSPALLIGWNDHLAWGATAAGIDQTDLFRIDVRGATRESYLLDGAIVNMVVENVTLEIAGEASQTVVYRETVFGPMVTEFVTDSQGEEFAARAYPMAGGNNDTIVGAIGAMRASSLAELDSALDNWQFPTINVIAGDTLGNVMYRLVGAVPIRSTRAPLAGVIAQEGDVTSANWQDILPGALMPKVTNPSGGNIVSGNHRPAGAWYPISLGQGTGSKGDTNRSARVRELVEALPAQATSKQVFDLVQFDCAEVGRRDLVEVGAHLAGLGMLSADANSAVTALATWRSSGGQTTVSADGAYLASRLNTKFRIADTGPQIQATYGGSENGYVLFTKTMVQAITADPSFVPTANEISFVDTMLADAWNAVAGVPQNQWTAAYQSEATFSLDHFALLGMPSVGTGVSPDTTLECILGSTVWSQKAQSYTQWVDLGDIDNSAAMMPLGNSEQLSAVTSQSQTSLWESGALRPAPLSATAFDSIAVSTITLE